MMMTDNKINNKIMVIIKEINMCIRFRCSIMKEKTFVV